LASKTIRVVSINDANQNETDFYATEFELLTGEMEKGKSELQNGKLYV